MPRDTTISIWTALERARSTFGKGLASLQLLVERNSNDIEDVRRSHEHLSEEDRIADRRLTSLEHRVPGDLLQRIVLAEERIEDLRDSKREVTGRIDVLRINEAKSVGEVSRDKVEIEDKKARWGIVVAVLTAVASLVFQVVRLFVAD